MFTLKMSNYSDKDNLQMCTYKIIDVSNNIICQERTKYISNVQRYLKNYFLKDVSIVSGKGTVYKTAEIKFKVA